MKTKQEIKDFVTKLFHYENYDDFLKFYSGNKLHISDELDSIIDSISLATQEEALKNAAENASMTILDNGNLYDEGLRQLEALKKKYES